MSNLNILLLKSTKRLLADEPLKETIYDHTHRKLDSYQEMMYRHACEAYSDMRAYFLTKENFNKYEREFLEGQRRYFDVCSNGLYSENPKYDIPSYLKREIEVMRGNLERYFAQFTHKEGGN
jgi:hypothetical protein